MIKQVKQSNSKLKFAAFCRVSTEKQEVKGESLPAQKTKCTKNVHLLGGKITAWYGGQEHATAGYEKKEIDRLLKDAQRKPKSLMLL